MSGNLDYEPINFFDPPRKSIPVNNIELSCLYLKPPFGWIFFLYFNFFVMFILPLLVNQHNNTIFKRVF